MGRTKQIAVNAFSMASPTQSWAGLWAHPKSNGLAYTDLEFWTDLARLCERGLIDAVFLADVLGANDVYGGTPDAVLRSGTMMPNNDPMMLISAMAAVSRDLCFGITGNTTYEQPYLLARRFSTLDHLTKGRVAWNVVTGILASTARAVGATQQVAHDARYDIADEYMELMYKLWEGCWEDGAAVRDKASRIFADPSRIHAVHHHGEHYRCDGIHLSEPSPQRTPLIYAAGASSRGRVFAGRHAECTFMSTSDIGFARKTVGAYRDEAVRAGRAPDSIKVFNAATVIVAPTSAEARDIQRDIAAYSDETGNLAMFSQWLGIDLSRYAPDDPITYVESNAIQSIMEAMTTHNPGRPLQVRDLGRFGKVGGREAFFVGSADEVCDEMAQWVEEADIDGFNLVRTVEPGGLGAFVDLVVPELQNRGLYKTAYAPGTMRQKFFPETDGRLPSDHIGSSFRHRVTEPA
ncbi:NtaA/DmoA family FMN-dependent monooxygenase [Sphingomonas histidinilytica]|uniref:FMN-dependent oxidoreductase, nitrilotriacetate monooxygenase family n=1 Tax=Rhizorhabdus histidinilytica TaxID=439228 RepID=A0A1T5CX45_9SPHN|nr:LLM class flavin-dependent oxidoreductase [Rhizorhabdus histidinilytica]MBO9376287.1 NtaA/DmoA family FMN-dependent monooxygenase [Rhizorhabdus histidinilytica]SKB63917.1 FMN-dependent oxidoreductase, nitrilotriacetate monooxygenase family [Rhizorhabdus histidinilytica]